MWTMAVTVLHSRASRRLENRVVVNEAMVGVLAFICAFLVVQSTQTVVWQI